MPKLIKDLLIKSFTNKRIDLNSFGSLWLSITGDSASHLSPPGGFWQCLDTLTVRTGLRGAIGIYVAEARDMLLNMHKIAPPCQEWSSTKYVNNTKVERPWGFPGGSESRESACIAEDQGAIPGLGRLPGERNGYPLQYPCLENFTDRGAWWAIVHGVTKSWTQLSD